MTIITLATTQRRRAMQDGSLRRTPSHAFTASRSPALAVAAAISSSARDHPELVTDRRISHHTPPDPLNGHDEPATYGTPAGEETFGQWP
jgi:hypothetical protein